MYHCYTFKIIFGICGTLPQSFCHVSKHSANIMKIMKCLLKFMIRMPPFPVMPRIHFSAYPDYKLMVIQLFAV